MPEMIHSYLFVPGNDLRKLNKALQTNADAIVLDLEDSVGTKHKAEAREMIHNWMISNGQTEKKIYLRMNKLQSRFGKEDLNLLLAHKQFAGVIVSKVETKADVPAANLFHNQSIKILPLIETALGVRNTVEIMTTNHLVDQIVFGVMDYCVDLQISYHPDHPLIAHAKYELILTCRSLRKKPPIDTIYPYIHDEEGLVKETKKALDLGMRAKMCIHPKQIDIVNAIFKQAYDEMTWAQKVKSAFEAADKQGIHVVNLNGEMIDYPVYLRALQILNQ